MSTIKFQEIADRLEFIKVPNALIKDDKINPSAKWCYIILAAHRNKITGKSYPSQNTISEVSGISLKQCNRAIQDLEDNHYITTTKHYQKGGERCNNIYSFQHSFDKDFTMIKTDVILKMLQKNLNHKNIIFYISLRRFTNNDTNLIKDTTKTKIAVLTGVNIKTVRTHLADLVNTNMIEITDSEEYRDCINIKLSFETELQTWEVM